MFVGNMKGGETPAVLALAREFRQMNGLDPHTWLVDVLGRIVSGRTTINQLNRLLPWNWKAEHRQVTA